MTSRYAVLFEYGTSLDFEPFPNVPAGALWMNDMYLCCGALFGFYSAGVTDVLVVSDMGGIYLTEAVASFENYGSMSFMHFADLDEIGELPILKRTIGSSVVDTIYPILVAPGNVMTELDFEDLSQVQTKNSKGKKAGKKLVTVVVIPGENDTKVKLPPGYKLSPVMALDRHAIRLMTKNNGNSIIEYLEALDNMGLVDYYLFDKFFFQVESEDDYLKMVPQVAE